MLPSVKATQKFIFKNVNSLIPPKRQPRSTLLLPISWFQGMSIVLGWNFSARLCSPSWQQSSSNSLHDCSYSNITLCQQSYPCWLWSGHPGGCRARCVYPESASQFLHKKASRRMRSRVESERERVFIRGTTQLATVETKTKRTAIRASSTLISFPRRVRAVAFSSPSNWTTCCCCCWSSILEILVWQASSASCRGHREEETLSKVTLFKHCKLSSL